MSRPFDDLRRKCHLLATLGLAISGGAVLDAQGRPKGETNLKNPPKIEESFPPPENPPAPETARLDVLGDRSMQVIGPGMFKIGDVILDQKKHEIRFPAELNMSKGPVEYFLSTGYGKVHECVLRAKAQPYHIHVGMLLLGAGADAAKSKEEIDPSTLGGPIRNPVWQGIDGDPVAIDVVWEESDTKIRRPANELMVVHGTERTMQNPDWIYNGSVTARGIFYAQLFGDLISVIPDEAALINSRAFKNTGGDALEANPATVPPPDASVEIIMRMLPQD